VLVIDSRRLEWRTRVDAQLDALVAGAIQLVTVGERAAQAGLSPDELLLLVEPVPLMNVELGRVSGRSSDDETAAFIMSLLLFWSISTYGAMVMTGVVEEKSSRTVEVLLARIPARNLLAGKISGIGLLGLAQIAATAVVALVAVALVDSIDVPAVRGGVVGWAIVWFLLGYTLYATVFGTLGSLASRTEDASSVTGPVMIVLVLGFIVSFAAIGSADTAWAQIVSWFPLTAPLAMPNRIAMGAASWWEPLGAAVLTIVAIGGLVVLGGRVYTRAILHTGTTMTLTDAWRGVPVHQGAATQDPITAEEVTATMRTPTTTGPARQRAVITGLAILIGAAVFALTSDFIIGVAVGAAFFALTGQIMKALRPAPPGEPASQDPDRETAGR
jgi:ABC-2 type transport system permease protein